MFKVIVRALVFGCVLFIRLGGAHAEDNIVGLDVLGRGALYSVNFERMSHLRVGGGGGIGFLSIDHQRSFIFPLYVSALPFGKTNSLYVSSGATIGFSNIDLFSSSPGPYSTAVAGTVTGGYQHTSSSGFVIRPTLTMFYNRSSAFCCWPGLMIGRSF